MRINSVDATVHREESPNCWAGSGWSYSCSFEEWVLALKEEFYPRIPKDDIRRAMEDATDYSGADRSKLEKKDIDKTISILAKRNGRKRQAPAQEQGKLGKMIDGMIRRAW